MTKALLFVKRASGVDRGALFPWLLTEHAVLVKSLPGVRRYTVSLEAEGVDRDFDALLEFWFDDVQAAAGSWRSCARARHASSV